MYFKQAVYIFMSFMFTSMSLCAQTYEVTKSTLFLKKLSYLMWHSFFFVPKILSAFPLGNWNYIAQALLLLAFMIMIESYCMHRFTQKSYRSTILYMTLINCIDIIAQAILAYPLFYLIDLHNYAQDFYNKIYSLYALTICASIIMLICRITISYASYRQLDTTTPKNLLKRAIIKTNCISYICIISTFFILKFINCTII